MSTKNMIHSAEVMSRQTNRHRPALFVITIILLAALVITLITVQSRNSQAAESASAQPVVYSNALEMQYAQPWLDKQKVEVAPAVQYSHALEMQYAQPWLEKQQNQNCNGRLDEIYACQYGNWQPQ